MNTKIGNGESTLPKIVVADGLRPFLKLAATSGDRSGMWNLAVLLLPQVGIDVAGCEEAAGTTISGATLAALREAQDEFLARLDEKRRRDRDRKGVPKESVGFQRKQTESGGIQRNPKDSIESGMMGKGKDVEKEKEDAVKEDGDRADDFEVFWKAYPRKDDKRDALKAWTAAANAKTLPPLPDILAALGRDKASDQWNRDGGKFIPYPATWIRRERWNNEGVDPSTLRPSALRPSASFGRETGITAYRDEDPSAPPRNW